MKELRLRIGGVLGCITAVVIAAMLCGTVVFVSMQNDKTQWDIANKQAQTMEVSASKVNRGLSDIGEGLCQTSSRQFVICGK